MRSVIVASGAVLACTLAWCSCAFALNPDLDISQYAHTSWKIRDGFSKATITSIAQTPDGYLWLGTQLGMLRFDGVKPVPWQPPSGQGLPSNNIQSLLVTRDGALWIGTEEGLARWKDGSLSRDAVLAGRSVFRLLEDHEGSIWATTFFNRNFTLCVIRRSSAECYGDDGGPGLGAIRFYEDRKGNLWVGTVGPTNGVWRWQPGRPKFYQLPTQPNGVRGLQEDKDGVLLIAQVGLISRFIEGRTELAYRIPLSKRAFDFSQLLRDRDGGLWAASSNGGGLAHIHRGIMDSYASSDGLSGDEVVRLFEDREGSIWVATVEGVDRFRDTPVATYSAKQGLSSSQVVSVLSARDGSIWIGTADRVNRWDHGRVSAYGVAEPGGVQSIFQDSRERVWVSTHRDVGYLDNDRLIVVKGLGGGLIRAIVEDAEANLWLADQELGLRRVSTRTGKIDTIAWVDLKHSAAASAMIADRTGRGLWLGFADGGVVYFSDGQVRASYGTADALGEGRVRNLRLDPDGALWAATEGGLSRLNDRRVATLTRRNGLPCDGVQWSIEDNDRATWLGMRCGLVRIVRAEMNAWIDSVQAGTAANTSVGVTVFESEDGFRVNPAANPYGSPVAKASDGRLWFHGDGGVSVVDPRELHTNRLPPPVHIEQVIADRNTYGADDLAKRAISFPALTRDLQIDYTALSLVAPEKMHFRYKLEGFDAEWQDAGTRRQAFYTNLPPRQYRFRVMASNNSGVWNEAGAALEFSIAPAYYQTAWFRAASVATILLLLAGLHRLRVMYLAQRFTIRMEERVNERTRIARELHDTMLQSFQGVLLKFHAATLQVANQPELKRSLQQTVEQAAQAISEGRDAVQALRSSTVETNNLAQAINALADDLARTHRNRSETAPPEFAVHVEGTTRDLAPLVRDDIYRIACEALRNAFVHAHATRIEVEIRYDPREVRVRVRDDGKGIAATVLAEGGREGHFGLTGMRERADLVGGKAAIWSKLGAGTEVELTVPGARAYGKAPVGAPISEGQVT